MSDRLKLNDSELQAAAMTLAQAANTMVDGKGTYPATLQGLTHVGVEVRQFVRGLQTGRAALADAAKSAAESVSGVMRESAETDKHLASTLYSGFAVEGRHS